MQKNKVHNEDLHRPRIGIDLMGGDTPPFKLLETLIETPFDEEHPPLFTLYGTQDVFTRIPPPFEYRVAKEVITPDDSPLQAIKKKPHSSIAMGIDDLKSHTIDVFISAGNTGALVAGAKLCLPMLPGISRPALMTLIPTKKEPVAVLDVGANLTARAEFLVQFAKMGIAYQKTRGITNPKVGLLNIGEEKQKGTLELQKAYQILNSLNETSPFDSPTFVGNIEGRDVFRGNIDILITDGFTGNVFLKTSEGIAGFILDQLEKLGPIESLPELRVIIEPLRHRLYYYEYPGAILCGVDGIIIKCHGESPPAAFIKSIKNGSKLIKHFFLEKIRNELLN